MWLGSLPGYTSISILELVAHLSDVQLNQRRVREDALETVPGECPAHRTRMSGPPDTNVRPTGQSAAALTCGNAEVTFPRKRRGGAGRGTLGG